MTGPLPQHAVRRHVAAAKANTAARAADERNRQPLHRTGNITDVLGDGTVMVSVGGGATMPATIDFKPGYVAAPGHRVLVIRQGEWAHVVSVIAGPAGQPAYDPPTGGND